MDAAAGLGLRDALYPVHAALILELGVGALAGHHSDNLLEAADSIFIHAYELHLPVVALRVVHIHAVKLRGKQCGLVAAGPGADLQNDVFVIVGVLGKQQDLELLLQLLDALFRVGELLLGKLPHLLVALLVQKRQTVLHVLLRLLVSLIRLHDGG